MIATRNGSFISQVYTKITPYHDPSYKVFCLKSSFFVSDLVKWNSNIQMFVPCRQLVNVKFYYATFKISWFKIHNLSIWTNVHPYQKYRPQLYNKTFYEDGNVHLCNTHKPHRTTQHLKLYLWDLTLWQSTLNCYLQSWHPRSALIKVGYLISNPAPC